MFNHVCRFLAVLFASTFASLALAAKVSILITSLDGSPVRHAVVSTGPRQSDRVDQTITMDQVDKTFSPHVIVVPAGADVSFPNSDQIRHHVYSFSQAKPFELRLYSGIPDTPVQFEEEGVVVVGCNIHDNMVGYIYVTQWARWGISDEAGALSLESSDSPWYVWHAALSLDAQEEIKIDPSTLEIDSQGNYVIQLPVETTDPHPQQIRLQDRDKFKRYLDL